MQARMAPPAGSSNGGVAYWTPNGPAAAVTACPLLRDERIKLRCSPRSKFDPKRSFGAGHPLSISPSIAETASVSIDLGTGSMPELEPGHKTPCFGYAGALVGCFVGSTFASWSEA